MTIYEAVSPEYSVSFGLFKSPDLAVAIAELRADGVSPPQDLRMEPVKTVPHTADWQIAEPITVCGRYKAYSPSTNIEAWVSIHRVNGFPRVDESQPALVY